MIRLSVRYDSGFPEETYSGLVVKGPGHEVLFWHEEYEPSKDWKDAVAFIRKTWPTTKFTGFHVDSSVHRFLADGGELPYKGPVSTTPQV